METKKERIKRHRQQASEVNDQFVSRTDDNPEKRSYRHANMRAGFRNGVINYHKHMGWLDE